MGIREQMGIEVQGSRNKLIQGFMCRKCGCADRMQGVVPAAEVFSSRMGPSS